MPIFKTLTFVRVVRVFCFIGIYKSLENTLGEYGSSQKVGIKSKSWGLGINYRLSKKEKINISNTFEMRSKSFILALND
jgi:hypothetical protein